jgi:lysophospholipase
MENNTTAPFYDHVTEGDLLGSAVWVRTDDGVRLRIGTWTSASQQKGTVFLFLGRFGYLERYDGVAKELAENGFSTVVVDWRSQGLSDRLTSNSRVGHVGCFDDYQRDVSAMLSAVSELGLPKPFHLLGISMGACIGLRSVLSGLPVESAAFISPMWGINMSPFERLAAWPLSWAAQAVGLGHKLVPGESDEIYVLSTLFEDNNLTNDRNLYDSWVAQARNLVELQIGGPSLSWLFGGLVECRRLAKEPSPDIPCLTFCGEFDSLVENGAIIDRMEKWPKGQVKMVAGAKHDVLSGMGGLVLEEICDFFNNAAPG